MKILKKKRRSFLPVLILSLFLNGTINVNTAEIEKKNKSLVLSAPDRILVKYRKHEEPSIQASIKAHVESFCRIQEIEHFSFIDVYLYSTYWDKEKTLEELNKNPNIEYAEPDYVAHASSTTPDDTHFNKLWGLHNTGQSNGLADADIDAPEAWDLSTGSSNVIVAVIDSGVDYNHEDLKANMWTNSGEIPNNAIDDDGNGYVDDYYGINVISGSGDPMDDHNHGTHCAGIIAAKGNNGRGVVGVCWTARIMALKFLDSNGDGFYSDSLKCIQYAINKGVLILNNSWGGESHSSALKDAIEAAKETGALFIIAAGNEGMNNDIYPYYPSSYDCDNIIAVTASNKSDLQYYNYGPYSVDVAAPGVSIYSTYPNNTYGYMSGTSMATPYVTGLAALIKSYNSALNWQQIKDQILSGADEKSSLTGKVLTGGRINASNSLSSVDVSSYSLDIQSSPDTNAYIQVSPNDLSSQGDGYTNFTRAYAPYTTVTLTAPSSHNGRNFGFWTVEGSQYSTSLSISITMDYNHTIEAVYPLQLALSPTSLNFGSSSDEVTSPQQFIISTTRGSSLDWSISDNADWLSFSPISGSGDAVITVSVDPTGLPSNTYTGEISISAPEAYNSPQVINVTLTVYALGADRAPFGSFDTPVDGSTVSGSIAATGWALDNVEVNKVEIKRDPYQDDPAAAIGTDGLVWIGNAVFVKGARTDVEAVYSDYPLNERAGWGYMLLTYGLPQKGNGTFTLHAIAEDTSGKRTLLGTKTITSDNDNRVKPFGTIDTPPPGGVVSGSVYVNFGWALTPVPKMIPTDGSTMNVYINSVRVGSPTYNQPRSDIANDYPTYLNKDGPVGYYYLDTTQYSNGVHTIGWEATDDQGAADGMGSRFFEIQNVSSSSASAAEMESMRYAEDFGGSLRIDVEGEREIEIEELGRIVMKLKGEGEIKYIGWGEERSKPLPIGSTLDKEKGIFYWMPGPGFLGKHTLHFAVTDGILMSAPVKVIINIIPKRYMIKKRKGIPFLKK